MPVLTNRVMGLFKKGGLQILMPAVALAVFGYELGVALLRYLKWAIMALGYPFPLDYMEGPLLDQTLRLAHFENIYRSSFATPPYTVSTYPPLFMLLQVPFTWMFGPALWYGRMISILCVFLAALFICLTIFTLTRDLMGSVVGGLLTFIFPYLQHWSLLNRIDELALALSWAGLFVTVRYVGRADNRPQPKWGFWLAVSLFVAAIYTRQTYALTAPCAALTWLTFETRGSLKDRLVPAAKLGLAIVGITMALFLLINMLTAGGFYLNIVTANVNAFYWWKVELNAKDILHSFYPLLILAGLFLLMERFTIDMRSRTWTIVLSYFLAAAAVSVTVGKVGSNMNYLIEFCAALSLAAGAALAWVGSLKWRCKSWVQGVIVAVLAFQASMMVDYKGIYFYNFGEFLKARIAGETNVQKLKQMVADAPGIVLADEYMALLPLSNKRLYIDPFCFKMLIEANIADETPFINDIRNRKFDLVLLYGSWPSLEQRWTRAQLTMLLQYYRPVEIIEGEYILRPRE